MVKNQQMIKDKFKELFWLLTENETAWKAWKLPTSDDPLRRHFLRIIENNEHQMKMIIMELEALTAV